MNVEDAIRKLRADPSAAQLIHDAYLGEDTREAAERFLRSGEWSAVLEIARDVIESGRVLDLGAGTGIASYALARSGAARVYALEPDPSDVVGRGALARLTHGMPVDVLDASGESIPIEDGTLDLVYTRQVLHHTTDLKAVARECLRVLRAGGMLLATREHVADSDRQLEEFRQSHPIHRLAGGESAHPLRVYLTALGEAGLQLERIIEPWASTINAYPAVRSDDALHSYPRVVLEERFGRLGAALARLPGIESLVRKRITRPKAGRMYSFVARKPG